MSTYCINYCSRGGVRNTDGILWPGEENHVFNVTNRLQRDKHDMVPSIYHTTFGRKESKMLSLHIRLSQGISRGRGGRIQASS